MSSRFAVRRLTLRPPATAPSRVGCGHSTPGRESSHGAAECRPGGAQSSTDTAGRTDHLVALNPQPLPPRTTIDFVALNPQPLPPSGKLDFVSVAAWPAD